MILMVLVVICYTITSLNDKYAVSKAGMNGSQMTFVMAAATSFFMIFTLPFLNRTIEITPLSFVFIFLLLISKLLEFQMSARILVEMSAFELKAWLGICMFMSYFTDIILGNATFTALKILCVAITAAGLIMIAKTGKKNVNYKNSCTPDTLSPFQIRLRHCSYMDKQGGLHFVGYGTFCGADNPCCNTFPQVRYYQPCKKKAQVSKHRCPCKDSQRSGTYT